MACQLTVSRDDPADVKVRQMVVKLDGESFATLLYGETASKPLAPGRHRLNVDNTWVWKTVDFSVAEGEQRTFRVINRAGRLTWWLVGLLGAGPMYITIIDDAIAREHP